jgi:hypothetical protein
VLDLYRNLVVNTNHFKQLSCADCLVSIYNCPLENKSQDIFPGKYQSVIAVEANAVLSTFFESMMPFFDANRTPDRSLINRNIYLK